jgi:hypothetical protein
LLILMAFRHALRVSLASWSTYAGSKSVLIPRPSISLEPRTVLRESMACRVTRCGCFVHSGASTLTRTSSSYQNARHRCPSTARRS